MISQGKKKIPERSGTLFEGNRAPKAETTSLDTDRLNSEIGRLKMERLTQKSQAGHWCRVAGGYSGERDRRCRSFVTVAH
jgi:hypothetical protein